MSCNLKRLSLQFKILLTNIHTIRVLHLHTHIFPFCWVFLTNVKLHSVNRSIWKSNNKQVSSFIESSASDCLKAYKVSYFELWHPQEIKIIHSDVACVFCLKVENYSRRAWAFYNLLTKNIIFLTDFRIDWVQDLKVHLFFLVLKSSKSLKFSFVFLGCELYQTWDPPIWQGANRIKVFTRSYTSANKGRVFKEQRS